MDHYGVPIEEVMAGGDDKTMWCRSIASGGIDLTTELPDSIWMWLTPPAKAPDKPTTITLSWQNGLPVALNGSLLPLDQIIEQLNITGGANGDGKSNLFEDGGQLSQLGQVYGAAAPGDLLKDKRDPEHVSPPQRKKTLHVPPDTNRGRLC